MANFAGKWKYQSYRPEPGAPAADPNPPTLVRWSPPGVVTVDEGGATGKLVLTLPPPRQPLTLDLRFRVTEGSPAGLAVSAGTMLPGGRPFTNELQGWFVPARPGQEVSKGNPLVVRGTIVQTSEDVPSDKQQPPGTTGFFVLEPLP